MIKTLRLSLQKGPLFMRRIESEGCGWLIEVDDIYYSPINVSENMQHDEQAVRVSFQILDEKVICGFPSPAAPRYNKIEIIEIEPG